jgi:hypothetical protein
VTPRNTVLLRRPNKNDLPVSQSKDKGPDIGTEDNDNAVDDDDAGEEPEEEQPEPDEDVDLLIHYAIY